MLGLGGCRGEPGPACSGQEPFESLARVADWQRTEVGADPFASHQPAMPSCPPDAAYAEATWFEVDTGLCNYVTVQQPIAFSLGAGAGLEVVLTHSDLIGAEPFDAHAALRVGDEDVWELVRHVEPPMDGVSSVPYETIVEQVRVEAPAAAGTPIYFHLHNHGDNTWNLIAVEAERCGGD